ncbi:DUF551 domain-containing protein [Escherichia coli]|nr:DUF551 domain-containing protein [Escherichia coli]EEV0712219.1 DUF551 domain-containing protein [Escherichia coli]EEV7679030.1 DUF551 domain-containing protein [Escherichia coli]EFF0151000.1 DUF551 domain-containing protein [Escherichia coli]EFF0211460.1 DUF551 domain-containing protein [Escherichia coli]
MTTITKERLQWLANISGRDDIDDIDGGEIRELALIALASLEAEPVASCIIEDGGMCVDGFGEYVGHSLPDGTHQLYAAPPVPDKLPREYIRGWPLAHSDYAEGWNDCREAMLQSGNFRENKNSSTNNFRRIPETSTNAPVIPDGWISCSERMPDDKQYVWCWGSLTAGLSAIPSKGITIGRLVDWSRNKWWTVTDDGEEPASKVTHWMPLPEPPQEVRQ